MQRTTRAACRVQHQHSGTGCMATRHLLASKQASKRSRISRQWASLMQCCESRKGTNDDCDFGLNIINSSGEGKQRLGFGCCLVRSLAPVLIDLTVGKLRRYAAHSTQVGIAVEHKWEPPDTCAQRPARRVAVRREHTRDSHECSRACCRACHGMRCGGRAGLRADTQARTNTRMHARMHSCTHAHKHTLTIMIQ